VEGTLDLDIDGVRSRPEKFGIFFTAKFVLVFCTLNENRLGTCCGLPKLDILHGAFCGLKQSSQFNLSAAPGGLLVNVFRREVCDFDAVLSLMQKDVTTFG